jgi:hypothetical protein
MQVDHAGERLDSKAVTFRETPVLSVQFGHHPRSSFMHWWQPFLHIRELSAAVSEIF